MTRSPSLVTAASFVVVALFAAGCPKAPQKGGPGLPHPMIAAMPDLVGFTTSLDGSASTDPAGRALTYSWHFSSVPPGSAITDAALGDATATMTTFAPDLGGEYGVTLTVSTPDGAINQATKTVVVPTVPIFYASADSDANATSFAASVIRSDGTGARPLSCPNRFDLGATATMTGDFAPMTEAFIAAMAGFRTWDGASPTAAFVRVGLNMASTSWIHELHIATDQTDCASRPSLRVDVSAQLGPADWQFFFPRFSPDGKRVAVLALGNTGTGTLQKIVTVGVDGAGFRAVRTIPSPGDRIIGPAWSDAGHVAWVEYVGTTNPLEFKIMTAADAAGAGDTAATTAIDCPAGAPFPALSQFDFVTPNTVVFAAATTASTGNMAGLINLYRETVGSCTAANKLTNETTVGHFSGDFVLSPDGKTIVYASTSGTTPSTINGGQLTDIFVVPVDGSAAPKRVAGDPNFADAAPRFIAGGRQIVWTQFSTIPVDGSSGASLPSSATLMMANSDGTNVRTLVMPTTKGGEAHYAISGSSLGNSCAIGGSAASAGAVAALVFALLVAFARRRRA